jgi:hypothetical protein
MAVCACPAASVVADDGLAVPVPVVTKVTVVGATGWPFASVTFTAKAPALVPTVVLALGSARLSTAEGGPGSRVPSDAPQPAVGCQGHRVRTVTSDSIGEAPAVSVKVSVADPLAATATL